MPFQCSRRSHQVTSRTMLVTLQKEQRLIRYEDKPTAYPTDMDRLDGAMGCGKTDQGVSDPEKLNFVDQIVCGADTFLKHYTATHFNGDSDRPLDSFPFFFKISDGIRHGGVRPHPAGDPVAFSVANRITYVQYRYTPWIQATPEGEGVYLFYSVWNSPRFRDHSWSGSSE